jgi:aminoglycoside 6-adenylyltransferase
VSESVAGGWSGREGLLRLRDRLHAWARERDGLVAAAAFGSTQRQDRPADDWSDLDLLFVVEDPVAWVKDTSWVEEIGPTWVRLVSPAPIPGVRVVQALFAGGYDADLIPVDRSTLPVLLDPDVASEVFGAGVEVLFDRDGRLAALTNASDPPGVRPPTAEAFDAVVSTFLYQTVWATKRLRRGELWRAHDDTDDYMRDRMLTMIEWHALARRRDGVFPESRKLERWVPDDVAAELPPTFARYEASSIAQALVLGLRLFRRLALEVADANGLIYPTDADAAIESWVLERLREGSFEVS